MEAQAGAMSTMSPALAYAPAASTACCMTVDASAGSMRVRGISGAEVLNASIIGSWSTPIITAALMVLAWSRTNCSNRAPLASPPAIHTTDFGAKLDREACAACAFVALESSTKRMSPPST